MTDIYNAKILARKSASATRKRAFDADPDAGEKLCRSVMAAADALRLSNEPRVVSVFWPMGTEVDTRPLIKALSEAGHTTALPVVTANAKPLTFRRWCFGDPLVDGGFGTSIPAKDAPEVTPEILFVPLLSFDDAGYRLGYGGGFYDRTLEKLRSRGRADAVGVAFSAQRVDTVIRGPHDQPLDWMATELDVRAIRTSLVPGDDEGNT